MDIMNKKQWVGVLMSLLLAGFMFPGCAAGTEEANGGTEGTTSGLFDPGYSDRDLDGTWDEENAVQITLDGDSIRVPEGSSGIEVNGSRLTITDAGTYVLTGTLTEGQVIVDAEKTDKVQVVLNNVDLTNDESAPIYVKQAEKVFLTAAEGSNNKISDGTAYTFAAGEDEPDGAIFSKDDLTVNGKGSLTVAANYKDGIVAKDDLVITAENVSVSAVGDGLRGKDSVAVKAGKLSIEAGADGIKATNDTDETKGWISIDGGDIAIDCANDGIQAETNLQVTAGNCVITAGGGSAEVVFQSSNGSDGRKNFDEQMRFAPADGAGGQKELKKQEGAANTSTAAVSAEDSAISSKGMKAGGNLYIADGSVTIDSADDAVHANENVSILKGTFTLASGDDGIHAGHALLIEEGTIVISKSYEGLEGATVTVNGGEINVTAADDAVNAAGGSDTEETTGMGIRKDEFTANDDYFIRIAGGTLTIDAGGDGVDSNGNLYVTGGKIIVNGPADNGNGILDYNGKAEISGGTFLGVGSAGMLQLFAEDSTQNTLAVTFTAQQQAGQQLTLKDATGKEIAAFTPAKNYQSVMISSAELKEGASYTLTGGSQEVSLTLLGVSTSVAEDGSVYERQGGPGGMRQEGMPGQEGENSRGTNGAGGNGSNRPGLSGAPSVITPSGI